MRTRELSLWLHPSEDMLPKLAGWTISDVSQGKEFVNGTSDDRIAYDIEVYKNRFTPEEQEEIYTLLYECHVGKNWDTFKGIAEQVIKRVLELGEDDA